MTKFWQRGLCLGAVALALTGCLPEDDLNDVQIKASGTQAAFPLMNTNLTVSDIITVDQNSRLVENKDHSYRIFYQSHTQTAPVADFFPAIPEQSYQQDFSLGITSLTTETPPQTFNDTIPFDLNGLTIYRIENKQGTLKLALSSTYQNDVKVKIMIPGIRRKSDGAALEWTPANINRWSSVRERVTEYPLSEYEIILTDGGLPYETEIILYGSGGEMQATDKVTVSLDIEGTAFSYLEGNFTDIKVPIPTDTLAISLLSGAVAGNVSLNPTLHFDFVNSFGIPILADFSSMYVGQQDGNKVLLTDKDEAHFFGGAYAMPYSTQREEPIAEQHHTVSEGTSNIKEAFSQLPQKFTYDLGFQLASSPEDTSFVTDQSQIDVNVALELPLEGTFDIILQDTIAVDFSDLDKVEEMKMLIKTENSFPIEANLQVFFLDKDHSLITDANQQPVKLFDQAGRLLTAATITNSNTGQTKPLSVDLPLKSVINQGTFELIRDATHLLVRVDLDSKNGNDGFVKLYSFYNVRFNLATQVKGSLNL